MFNCVSLLLFFLSFLPLFYLEKNLSAREHANVCDQNMLEALQKQFPEPREEVPCLILGETTMRPSGTLLAMATPIAMVSNLAEINLHSGK